MTSNFTNYVETWMLDNGKVTENRFIYSKYFATSLLCNSTDLGYNPKILLPELSVLQVVEECPS